MSRRDSIILGLLTGLALLLVLFGSPMESFQDSAAQEMSATAAAARRETPAEVIANRRKSEVDAMDADFEGAGVDVIPFGSRPETQEITNASQHLLFANLLRTY